MSEKEDLGVAASPPGSRPTDGAASAGVSTPDGASIPNADALGAEVATAWLNLGRFLLNWANEPADWMDTESSADHAIAMLDRGERCMLRAASAMSGSAQDAQRLDPEGAPARSAESGDAQPSSSEDS